MSWLTCAPALAMPIRPDIKKLLANPPKQEQFAPARAGWDGPETASDERSARSATLDRFGPEGTRRAMRQSLADIALPDWREVLALVAAVLLLRVVRSRATRETAPPSQSTAEAQRPAA